MNQGGTIKSFTDLNAWKESHKLAIQIYRKTKTFPIEERFGLIDQIRRASVSVCSNIAEGFSRNYYKEKLKFYSNALGSATEVQSQLLIARDVGYLQVENFNLLAEQTIVVHKLLNGLIKSTKAIICDS